MEIRPLSSISFDEVLASFLQAFENYFVKMPTDKQYYENRWKAAKVDWDASYGMFDQSQLVGFIIHAIDRRNQLLTAFNTGTGVIPAYRGKRIIQSIYTHALKDLAQRGIQRTTLEVITKNHIAVRLYQGVGFEIIKKYLCFKGSLPTVDIPTPSLVEREKEAIDWDALPHQDKYSWDNQRESILEGAYRYFQVLHEGEAESFFIIQPAQHYVAQMGLLQENNQSWDRLFASIRQISPAMKINNVDNRLTEKIHQLQRMRLEHTVDQYEMELAIAHSI
ncbi:MAG: GNAT family N-acetyltransferase [Bacteroidota bacterium]